MASGRSGCWFPEITARQTPAGVIEMTMFGWFHNLWVMVRSLALSWEITPAGVCVAQPAKPALSAKKGVSRRLFCFGRSAALLHSPPAAVARCPGLALSLPASLCSRQGKCLPNFFAPLTPPPAAVARNPPQIAVDDTCYPKNERECSP